MHKKALQAILSKKSPAALPPTGSEGDATRLVDHAMSLDMLDDWHPLTGVKLVADQVTDGHCIPWEAAECVPVRGTTPHWDQGASCL